MARRPPPAYFRSVIETEPLARHEHRRESIDRAVMIFLGIIWIPLTFIGVEIWSRI